VTCAEDLRLNGLALRPVDRRQQPDLDELADLVETGVGRLGKR
jgi:hypothetical protein